MIDELLAYDNAELAHLREMGAEFAERYPKVAARLLLETDKCEDPHVERILEGVAFLTARIRHKIDDEFPEITDSLLGILYPHFQRPCRRRRSCSSCAKENRPSWRKDSRSTSVRRIRQQYRHGHPARVQYVLRRAG